MALTPTSRRFGPVETASGVIPSMSQSLPLAEFTTKIGDDLAARLARNRASFPRKPGRWSTPGRPATSRRTEFACSSSFRKSWTDAFIPMHIEPQPQKDRPRDGGPSRNALGRPPAEGRSGHRQPRARAILAKPAGPIVSCAIRAVMSSRSFVMLPGPRPTSTGRRSAQRLL